MDSPCIQKAAKFLLGKQNKNGGWGESYLACVNKAYPEDGTGPVRSKILLKNAFFPTFLQMQKKYIYVYACVDKEIFSKIAISDILLFVSYVIW